jgi:hypothetical protein
MRRHLVKSVALAGALVTLTIPAFNMVHGVSACSNPGCTTTTVIAGTIETFVSPITVTAAVATFQERATSAQTTTIVLTGSVGFTVGDFRGNNQGWIATLTSNGFRSSLISPTITAANISVAPPGPTVTLTCFTLQSLVCAPGRGVAASIGATLDTSPAVAVECPFESIGFGSYAVFVPIRVNITGLTAELFGSLPVSWLGSFTVSVTEGQDPTTFAAAFGCPVFPPVT